MSLSISYHEKTCLSDSIFFLKRKIVLPNTFSLFAYLKKFFFHLNIFHTHVLEVCRRSEPKPPPFYQSRTHKLSTVTFSMTENNKFHNLYSFQCYWPQNKKKNIHGHIQRLASNFIYLDFKAAEFMKMQPFIESQKYCHFVKWGKIRNIFDLSLATATLRKILLSSCAKHTLFLVEKLSSTISENSVFDICAIFRKKEEAQTLKDRCN